MFLASFLLLPSALSAQGTRIATGEETVRWSGEATADIQVRLMYNAYAQEPIKKAVAGATRIHSVVVNGNTVTEADVGPAVWGKLEIMSIDVAADIYEGNRKVTTVQFDNLTDVDMAGSPDWDEVFPGVDSAAARGLFERGFSIRNIRVTDAFVSGTASISLALREQAAANRTASPPGGNTARAGAAGGAARGAAGTRQATSGPPAGAAGSAGTPPGAAAASNLTDREQRAYADAIASARQNEAAGNLVVAISDYRYAYGIHPDPAIEAKIDELVAQRGEKIAAEHPLAALASGGFGAGGVNPQDERWLLIGSDALNMLSSIELSEEDQQTVQRLQEAHGVVDMLQMQASSQEEVELLNKVEGVAQAVIVASSLFGGDDDEEEAAAPVRRTPSQENARRILLSLQDEVQTVYERYQQTDTDATDLAGVRAAMGQLEAYERQSAAARLLLLYWYDGLQTGHPNEATLVAWRQRVATLQEEEGIEGLLAAIEDIPGMPQRYRANLPYLLNAEHAFSDELAVLERRRAALEDPEGEARAAEAALASSDPSVMAAHLRRYESPRAEEIRTRMNAFYRISSGISSLQSEIGELQRRNKVGKWLGLPSAGLLTLIGVAVGPSEYPLLTAGGVGALGFFGYIMHRNGNRMQDARMEIERLKRERAALGGG